MEKINYDGRTFRAIDNTANGEVSAQTLFHYRQEGRLVTATYAGGEIVAGHLIALVDEATGALDMRYHHLNGAGNLQTGICRSVPEVLPNGRLRLHETWQWTSGDGSAGSSIVEEVKSEK